MFTFEKGAYFYLDIDWVDPEASKTATLDGSVTLENTNTESFVFEGDIRGVNLSAAETVKKGIYTVASLPSAVTRGAGTIVWVSNETGGAQHAQSDGTDWNINGETAIITVDKV